MLLARVRLRLGQAVVLGSAGLGVALFLGHRVLRVDPVSYTHLDVYKRQLVRYTCFSALPIADISVP